MFRDDKSKQEKETKIDIEQTQEAIVFVLYLIIENFFKKKV